MAEEAYIVACPRCGGQAAAQCVGPDPGYDTGVAFLCGQCCGVGHRQWCVPLFTEAQRSWVRHLAVVINALASRAPGGFVYIGPRELHRAAEVDATVDVEEDGSIAIVVAPGSGANA